jgi:hypothetical protein
MKKLNWTKRLVSLLSATFTPNIFRSGDVRREVQRPSCKVPAITTSITTETEKDQPFFLKPSDITFHQNPISEMVLKSVHAEAGRDRWTDKSTG